MRKRSSCYEYGGRSYHKMMWTVEEDEKLTDAVEKLGLKNWNAIAQLIEGRNGKQCRERWACMLNPELSKEAWTQEEDELLIKLHAQFGNRWRYIANFLPGRSRINLRNRWSLLMRHEKGSAHNKKLKQSGVKAKKVSTETKIQKTNEVIKKDDKSNLLNNLPFWINSPNSIFARSFNQVSDCSHHENQFPVDLFDNLTGNGISQCEPKIESSGFDSSFEENSPIETSYERDVKSDTDEHYEKEKKNLNESESDPEIGMIIWEDWHISVPEVEKHQITTNKYLEWY